MTTKRRWQLFTLLALAVAVAAATNLTPLASGGETPLPAEARADRITVDKSDHGLTLWSDGRPLKT